LAAWAACPSAAVADALSTAFMVMKTEEVEAYCLDHPDTASLVVIEADQAPKVLSFGSWDTAQNIQR